MKFSEWWDRLDNMYESEYYTREAAMDAWNYQTKTISTLEAENAKQREAAKAAKVLLDDATYHDGRYDQHTSREWQKEACRVSALLEKNTG